MKNILEIFGLSGKQFLCRQINDIISDVKSDIFIHDSYVHGEQVIALHVKGVPVEYVSSRYDNEKDIDGYSIQPILCGDLIKRMETLRTEEIDKRIRKEHLQEKMKKYGILTYNDLNK